MNIYQTKVVQRYHTDFSCITLLNYPSINKQIKMHNNDSNFKLGLDISKNGNPIYSYSIKVTGPQKKVYDNRKVTNKHRQTFEIISDYIIRSNNKIYSGH